MKIKPFYLVAAVFLFFCLLENYNTFNQLEWKLQDFVLQQKYDDRIDSKIIIVGIDDDSLSELGRWQDWKRENIAKAIERISQSKPAVIGVDITYNDKSPWPGDDDKLALALKNAENVVLPVQADFGEVKIRVLDKKRVAPRHFEPIEIFKQYVKLGHINGFPDTDGVVRRAALSYSYAGKEIESFDWAIYKEYMQRVKGVTPDKSEVPVDDYSNMFIDFNGDSKAYSELPISRVINGDFPEEYLKDKIVLIGPYSTGMAIDTYLTPMDSSFPMFGVEIHANIIQNMVHQNYKKEVPLYIQFIILALLALLGYLIFKKLNITKSVLALLGIVTAYVIVNYMLYQKGYMMYLLYPVLLLVTAYIIMLAYHYIREYLERKRITGVFGRYVAPQVVSQIIDGGEEGLKLGGTRREISVLFVDIRGFTPMSEKCEPEEIVEILNEYLNLTATSIFQFGGTLDKFIGDAAMAIFNAPLDLEDHVFKAVRAAWAMKQGAIPLQEKLQEKYGRSVQFGIGVNTGQAVVGNIGAKFRMDYTAIGDTVNTSARLESNAKPGQILISQAVYEQVKERIQATSLGEIKVKGKEMGLQVYQLDGILE